jgi:beta-glucosidase
MEDTYLPAFRAAVTEGKAGSVMCAYNRINGEPACANTFLLEDQLRGKWGFQGYVVSDCDAVVDIERGHHFTKTLPRPPRFRCSAARTWTATTKANRLLGYEKYLNAVKQGLLAEKDLTFHGGEAAHAGAVPLGMFDPPEMVKYAQTPDVGERQRGTPRSWR